MNIQTQLPTGYTSRCAVLSDLPAAVNLLNAYSQHINGSNMVTERDLEPEWQMQDYRPETHIRLVFDPQGQLAGYIEFWDLNHPCVIMHAWGRKDPAYSDPSIMAYLLEWAEQRARQSMASLPTDLRVALRSGVPSLDQELQAQLTQAGYQNIRRFWRIDRKSVV